MEKHKILVLGKGFLGQAFEKKGYEVGGKDKFSLDNELGEYETNQQLHRLRVWEYDVIINCIGKSNTRWCEQPENWEETFNANAEIPRILSNYFGMTGKKFVHISTGCFYDKNDAPKREDDNLAIATHCNYTLSKLVGEHFCNPEKDLIVRPRLYCGDFGDKNNLLCKLSKFERHLTEQNSYTSVHVIVDAVSALLDAEQSGIFNVACDRSASVKDLAEWCGLPSRETISAEELRQQQGIYLVNNIMDISKLQKFYQPPKLKDEIIRCWSGLKK